MKPEVFCVSSTSATASAKTTWHWFVWWSVFWFVLKSSDLFLGQVDPYEDRLFPLLLEFKVHKNQSIQMPAGLAFQKKAWGQTVNVKNYQLRRITGVWFSLELVAHSMHQNQNWERFSQDNL